jgi:hypothetical protein
VSDSAKVYEDMHRATERLRAVCREARKAADALYEATRRPPPRAFPATGESPEP